MCFFKKTPSTIWVPTEYPLSVSQLYSLYTDTKDHVYMWDSQYYVLTLEDWQKVFKDVLTNMPKYLAEKLDCEDMAFICLTRIIEKYQINGCGVAVGNSPMGYHGFNTFVASENGEFKRHILEPQNGIFDPMGYELETVIFG